jgi:hypothetical protein
MQPFRERRGPKYDRVLASTATSPCPLGRDDPRLSVRLFTLRESAAYLHTPVAMPHAWARPKDGEPLVTVFPRAGRQATVPFVGSAAALVLGALRSAGVPMQRIRPAVAKLSAEIGLEHALASQRVYAEGAELIFDFAAYSDDEALLTVVRTGQQHFAEIIRGYLKRITCGDDGWAKRLRLPAYARAEVTVDPRQAFGHPLVVHGGARVEDASGVFADGPIERAHPRVSDLPRVHAADRTTARRGPTVLALIRYTGCALTSRAWRSLDDSGYLHRFRPNNWTLNGPRGTHPTDV